MGNYEWMGPKVVQLSHLSELQCHLFFLYFIPLPIHLTLSKKTLVHFADVLTAVDMWYCCEDLSYSSFSWALLANSQQAIVLGLWPLVVSGKNRRVMDLSMNFIGQSATSIICSALSCIQFPPNTFVGSILNLQMIEMRSPVNIFNVCIMIPLTSVGFG